MSATSRSSEQSHDELGPRCPKCGAARWQVYRSTKNERAWIRKRKCKACGYTYTSIENGPSPRKAYPSGYKEAVKSLQKRRKG